MKIMKKPVKNVKKAMYRGRVRKFRQFISLMLVGGILASVLYFGYYAYVEYAVSRAHVILSYPEIANSQYPDESRFTYYDFVSNDRIEEALKIMQENGKYESYTAEDLSASFYVQSYLDDSASTNVSAVRSEGNDFSYVANEYKIIYVQPHDYSNPNFFKKIFSSDYSDEFLRALVDINKQYIAEAKGGLNGFDTVTDMGDTSTYDYDEKVEVYRTKIDAVTAFIDKLEAKAPKFVSQETDMTLQDIKGRYELLITNKIDSIADFVETSGISKNPEVAINKIKVNIEDNTLKNKQFINRAEITQYAMKNYDQTFTENLINVVRNETQGLYQARPKTSFDTVVSQMNQYKENVSEYTEELVSLNKDLERYTGAVKGAKEQDGEKSEPEVSTEELTRISQKCDTLFAELDKEYEELTMMARAVVRECLNETNEDFVVAEVERNSIFSISLLTKLGVVFLTGAILMFVLCILFYMAADSRELKRKKKQLKKIKTAEKGA